MTNDLLSDITVPYLSSKSLSQSTGGFLMLDSNYKVVGVNAAYVNFHHIFNEAEVVTGHNLRLHGFDAFPDIFTHTLAHALEGEVENVKLQLEYLDHHDAYEVTIAYCALAGTKHGACIMVEKKTQEATARKGSFSESFYKRLIDNCTTAYILADAALTFTYVSNGIEEALGYAPSELIGRNAIEFVRSEDKEFVKDWLIDVRRQRGKRISVEYQMLNKEGEYVWIENTATNLLKDVNVKAIVFNIRNIQSKRIADNTLIQAEQRLSLLLNNTAESFIILNSRLRIVTYNKAAQERSPFIYTHHLQSGLSVLDLINKEEIPEYINLFEEVFKGNVIEKEAKVKDREGAVRIFNHSFRPLSSEQNDISGVIITSTEITERKKLEEAIGIHSERLKTAQEIAKLGYLEYDLATKTFFCSELFYDILGISKEVKTWDELKVLQQYIHPDDKEVLRQEIEHCLNSCTTFSFEFRFAPDSAKEKIILVTGEAENDDTGKTVKLRVTLQDITDSKMALLAMQALESKFKSLFEHSIDGVILSKENGDVFSANPAACAMLGYTQDEIVLLSRKNVVDESSPVVREMSDTREQTGVYRGELALRHKSGRLIPVEVTSVSMNDADGSRYFSTILRDITEKKKRDAEQQALTEELQKNNQDLQQFSFITSHNMRAPVANLISLLSLYNKETPADEFNLVLVEKFEEATKQLNQTLNDLVNILVIKSNTNIEKETISLPRIFESVKANIDSLLQEQGGVIETDFSEVDAIQYNRIHIESLFLNMITNAIRYRSPERAPIIKIKSHRSKGYVIVEFSDNGLGMDLKRYGDRLFGLYQRFHGNKEGKGLGLYMTHSQVTAMGGKIEVESEPGKGTTFRVYFKQ